MANNKENKRTILLYYSVISITALIIGIFPLLIYLGLLEIHNTITVGMMVVTVLLIAVSRMLHYRIND